MNRRALLHGLAGLVASGNLASSKAQAYPAKPITLVVPFTPGGTTDILARLLGQKLQMALGQSVIIENKGGAGGSLGSASVANAVPDGHTLLLGHVGTLAVNPGIYPKLPYDPLQSFAMVSMLAGVHNVLAVHPSLPVRSVGDLIAYVKERPGQINFGSGGKGSAAHIATAAFADAAGLNLVHVPYRGTAPAVQDLLGNNIQMILTGAPAILPLAADGKLRALAVSGKARIAAAPNLPTIAEAALPGFEASQWYGIVAPAATPSAIVARLNSEIRSAYSDPGVVETLAKQGAEVWLTSPAEFREIVVAEIARWGTLIRRASISAE